MLALFDIDGTLLSSAGAGKAAIKRALIDVYGTAGPIDELPFDGMTDPQIANALLGEAGLSEPEIETGLGALWTEYLRHLPGELEARADQVRTPPGVPELVDALERVGSTLGLVTGNIADGARTKLAACGLNGRFAFGAFGSDATDRNALPPIALDRAYATTGTRFTAGDAWIIGDTPADIACAHASNMRVLAVATGRFSTAELTSCGADRVVSSFTDTHAVMTILNDEGRARAS
ncbi:MAG: HAD family hydrolase [Gemmatimonadetes bacterium]|nr:HAD family hydrolase [Gemmatimonadota bacterium]